MYWLVSWETLAQAVVTIARLVLQVTTVPQSGQSPALWAPTSITQPFITHSESVSTGTARRCQAGRGRERERAACGLSASSCHHG